MAKHLEITNDNHNVIIDDQYSTPMLLYKGLITASTNSPLPSPPNMQFWRPYYPWYSWRGTELLFETYNTADIPFSIEPFDSRDVLRQNKQMIVAGRCINTDAAVNVFVNFALLQDAAGKLLYRFSVTAESDTQNAQIEVCVYSLGLLKPTKNTLAIYNQRGELLYDALRPPMHYIGNMYGNVDYKANPAATYNINMPAGIDSRYCYMTTKSTLPYYAAFRIHSRGVDWADTTFKAVMVFPTSSSARVQLWRARNVSGNNSSYGNGLYFENLVYCPYPYGKYF